jgi:hypothetical protein
MKSAIAYVSNLPVLGGQDVASCANDMPRELSIDELTWVAGGEVTGGTK